MSNETINVNYSLGGMVAPVRWKQGKGFVGMCEHIARCAAICYDSTPKVGDEAIKFVERLIKLGHGRALEFGTVWLKIWATRYTHNMDEWRAIFVNTPYARYVETSKTTAIVTTNLRFLLERTSLTLDNVRWLWGGGRHQFGCDGATIALSDPESTVSKFLEPRPTVFYSSIGRAIADEFRTHTTLSTLMRSSRYTGAGKERGFIVPEWFDGSNIKAERLFIESIHNAMAAYSALIELGYRKEQARDVLPLCVSTQLVQCGFMDAWDNFIRLRTDKAAHPQARTLAKGVEYVITHIKQQER